MTPFFFGTPSRRLFGVFHPGEGAAAGRHAVLLCNPFGQEAIRTHRLYRVLADRLARSGIAVLRFEYFGTGDSAGEDVEGDLDGWGDDVLEAHQELARLSMASQIMWMGGRLGAALALKVLPHVTGDVNRLVVWDPVLDGSAYHRLLKARHADRLREVFLRGDVPWRQGLMAIAREPLTEASGFPVSPVLETQLDAMSPSDLKVPRSVALHAIFDPEDELVPGWLEVQRERGVDTQAMPLKRSFDWMEHEAAHGALVPAQALQQLLSAMKP